MVAPGEHYQTTSNPRPYFDLPSMAFDSGTERVYRPNPQAPLLPLPLTSRVSTRSHCSHMDPPPSSLRSRPRRRPHSFNNSIQSLHRVFGFEVSIDGRYHWHIISSRSK